MKYILTLLRLALMIWFSWNVYLMYENFDWNFSLMMNQASDIVVITAIILVFLTFATVLSALGEDKSKQYLFIIAAIGLFILTREEGLYLETMACIYLCSDLVLTKFS